MTRLRVPALSRLICFGVLAWTAIGCSDVTPPAASDAQSLGAAVHGSLVVSEPTSVASVDAAARRLAGSAVATMGVIAPGLVYVSLAPGTLPADVVGAEVRNATSGGPGNPVVLIAGGFDPVAIVASIGDEIELRVRTAGGRVATAARLVVPPKRPPRIVRTEPPKGKTDVAVNSSIRIVFSEPIAPATLDTTTVLLLHEDARVAGMVRFAGGSLFEAEFVPDGDLESMTAYRLVVTRSVRDLANDALDEPADVGFTTGEDPTPPPVIDPAGTELAAGSEHTCGLTAAGAAFCWGANDVGQLGDGTTTNRPSPVAVTGGLLFTSITAGLRHTCALESGGRVYCWGWNDANVLGVTTTGADCEYDYDHGNVGPMPCSRVPIPVSTGLTFRAIAAGTHHVCGLTSTGAAYCWGWNDSGQGGNGDRTRARLATPTPVVGDLRFGALAAGAGHTCGLTLTGAAHCWGLNVFGELGVGPGTTAAACGGNAPWPCSDRPVRVAGGRTFVDLTAGSEFTCALTAAGAAYCWGLNYKYALGVRAAPETCRWGEQDFPCSATPVPVEGGGAFREIGRGPMASHACGVTMDGATRCWGDNASGQLGAGAAGPDTPDLQTVTGGHTFRALALGQARVCGRAADGGVYCWGSNGSGQLGDGSTTDRAGPVRVIDF